MSARMSQVVLEPEIVDAETGAGRWMVLMFNNDTTSMDEVVDILMRATGCDVEEAVIEMWEAHTFGKASVHFASKLECEEVASVINSIGVKTQVTREWED
jgi:ATP-dependent Clp protease adapter protein ClpS